MNSAFHSFYPMKMPFLTVFFVLRYDIYPEKKGKLIAAGQKHKGYSKSLVYSLFHLPNIFYNPILL